MPRLNQIPTVLVVDDESAILRILTKALTKYDIAVLSAEGGEAGVKAYHQHHESIALVLIDVQMPLPWDGPFTLAEMKRVDPFAPVAFMTGSPGKYSVEQLLELGAMRVFDKPFPSVTSLASDLKELMARTHLHSEFTSR